MAEWKDSGSLPVMKTPKSLLIAEQLLTKKKKKTGKNIYMYIYSIPKNKEEARTRWSIFVK